MIAIRREPRLAYAGGRGPRGAFGGPAAGLVVIAVAVAVWAGGVSVSAPLDAGSQAGAPAAASVEGVRDRALEALADVPPTFVENAGQTDPRVRYYAQGSRYAFYLTRRKILFSFVESIKSRASLSGDESSAGGVTLALRFLGANPHVVVEASGRSPGEVNYLRGNDPARWHTELPSYSRVVYRRLWPGVDLMLRGKAGELKYEFRVHPGARLEDIRLAYGGASGLALGDAGGLRIDTAMGVLRDSPPVSYHEVAGARVPVESRYVLKKGIGAKREYGFALGAGYRPDRELIIDPSLNYSTFLGGSNHDFGNGIATDAKGNAYVVGATYSNNFPTTVGAFDRSLAAAPDVFVGKLNPAGSALVYSTYLGGTPTPVPAGGSDPFEFGRGIAVDAAGNAYVTGQTTSGNFPTTPGAFDRSFNGGFYDAFATKLTRDGSDLVYSTFLGGSSYEGPYFVDAVALDPRRNVYIAGFTTSPDWPTTPGAFDTT
ncbi:MAG: SBBP repeat-containing protein, partial [Actinomycetota bacterium]